MTKKRDYGDLVGKILRAKELGKKHYNRADRLLDELLADVKPTMTTKIQISRSPDKWVILKDNFDGKNKAFRSHGVARFELEVVEA